MELTEITFKKGNLIISVEDNPSTSGYTVDIVKQKEAEDLRHEPVARFRTDEVELDELIEALKFIKSYNFIQ